MTPKQNIEICAFAHMLFCVLKWATLPKFAYWTICQNAHLCWMLMCLAVANYMMKALILQTNEDMFLVENDMPSKAR
jgi:hypothetical protein